MSSNGGVNDLQQTLAEALGEDPEAIQAANPRWLTLMQEGVLVSVHIGRWRAKTSLTWGDLGIRLEQKANRELSQIINLGYKKLLPAYILKELDAIDSAARKWLERKAYRTYWGYFVPVTAYEEWKEKNEEYRARYFEMRDQLLRDYEQLVNGTVIGYRVAARQAYSRMKQLYPGGMQEFKSEDHFVEIFTGNIRAHIASKEEIRRSFYFETEIRYVPLPSLLAEEKAEAQHIRDMALLAHNRAEYQQQLEQEEFQAERDRIWAETRAAQSAAEWKEELMKQMHADVVAQARQQKEEMVDGFLRDVVVQLRSLVYDATTDVLAAIQRNQSLPPRSVVQLKNMVDQVKSLNFYGDEEIERMVKRIAWYANQEAQDRDVIQIKGNLRDIATVVRASLIGLGNRPRQARELGIADAPSEEMVRSARRGLGLDGEIEGEMVVRLPRLETISNEG